MKKLFLMLLLVPFMFIMIGCDEDPTEAISPPSSLQLVGATDGAGLVLTWSPSSTTDIDGYRIYFNGTEVWEGTATTYTHPNASLGEYQIVAYRGSEESDPLTRNTQTSIQTGTGMIYAFYVSDQPSGYGWNLSAGTGSSYSFTTGNASYIDFYYDNDNDLTSADVYSTDFPNETGFVMSSTTYNDLGVVPATGAASYTNYVTPGLNQTYAVIIKKGRSYGNYAKLQVTGIDTAQNSISFRWTLQTIDKWRVVGD
ncbi:MAG TPA: hypothetical protein ENN75_02110 [candidate division Zixibacteria bacterium]|nr:hypothetical protein [candidate division Zixibacteria bacterium]